MRQNCLTATKNKCWIDNNNFTFNVYRGIDSERRRAFYTGTTAFRDERYAWVDGTLQVVAAPSVEENLVNNIVTQLLLSVLNKISIPLNTNEPTNSNVSDAEFLPYNSNGEVVSLENVGGTTVEQVLRIIMNMPPGSKINGEVIAKMDSKFSKAEVALENIIILNSKSVQVNLTFAGKMLVNMSPDYSNIDGAIFNLSNYKNKYGVESVHVQSNMAKYGDKPLNYYVNDNQFSLYGLFFSNLFKK